MSAGGFWLGAQRFRLGERQFSAQRLVVKACLPEVFGLPPGGFVAAGDFRVGGQRFFGLAAGGFRLGG